MTINAVVSDNEIHYLNIDSTNVDQYHDSLPKHINAKIAYDKESLRELLESYDRSVLTIVEAAIDISLPEDFKLLK